MQDSSSYESITGPSAHTITTTTIATASVAGATTVYHDQKRQPFHQLRHDYRTDNVDQDKTQAALLAPAAATSAAGPAFSTSNIDLSSTQIQNVATPLPLNSINLVSPMFSTTTSSSPNSYASSTSISISLNIQPSLKPINGGTILTPAESSMDGNRKEQERTPTSSSTELPRGIPGKRTYKPHVPSACINCKKAHLACDVSRPCTRCVALGKIDTCQDIKHKKRGRPRLRDKHLTNQTRDSCYEVMYGTMQTPAFALIPPIAPHPPAIKSNPPSVVTPPSSAPPLSTVTFIHETSNAFQQHAPLSTAPVAGSNQLHQTSYPAIDTAANPNSNFLNTLACSFAEVSFVDPAANGVQQPYEIESCPSVFSVNAHQQHRHQLYPSQCHPISQQHKEHDVREIAMESIKLDNAHPKQHGLVHDRHTLLSTPQHATAQSARQINTQYRTTRKSPPPPPTLSQSLPLQRQQSSAPSPIEQHLDNIRESHGTKVEGKNDHGDKPIATIVMSMEVCCARVSSEVTELWGYYPQEFSHRSFYDFISPKDSDRLARLHRLLLDNMVEMAQTTDPHFSLPDTERTTSDLFHNCSLEQLMLVAPGSSSFSDTLHVKKRSGDMELYEMIVCMGGALGADLSHPASLSKVYIIGQLKKHEYEVSSQKYSLGDHSIVTPIDNSGFQSWFQSPNVKGLSLHQPPSTISLVAAPAVSKSTALYHQRDDQRQHQTSPSSSEMILARIPTTFPPTSHPTHRQTIMDSNSGGQMFRTTLGGSADRFLATSGMSSLSMPAKDTARSMGYQELRTAPSAGSSNSTLPMRFKSSSYNNGSKMEPAKVNVAPITTQTKYSANMTAFPQKLKSNTLPPMFRHNSGPSTTPGAVYANGPSAATAPAIGESSNPYSTLASYRHSNTNNGPTSVTHPTTQYFLQTSSSTLNAAASITRQKGLYMSSVDTADSDKSPGSSDSNRKMEMSIRSLLC
ncbi:hypothetical protein BX666DRAFT_1875644 [Dichotomocladium elegans]|nr:hypothetical protein BX666DRAFT_1875644 [Dichotomocladium elegans]